ncbi:hypothetical protein NSP_53510 [Nodularia spumigena CCY9414]|nr:hypothetical protein NSP_53510 [Nodularia spumigena CCY9414]
MQIIHCLGVILLDFGKIADHPLSGLVKLTYCCHTSINYLRICHKE